VAMGNLPSRDSSKLIDEIGEDGEYDIRVDVWCNSKRQEINK